MENFLPLLNKWGIPNFLSGNKGYFHSQRENHCLHFNKSKINKSNENDYLEDKVDFG